MFGRKNMHNFVVLVKNELHKSAISTALVAAMNEKNDIGFHIYYEDDVELFEFSVQDDAYNRLVQAIRDEGYKLLQMSPNGCVHKLIKL